ncbi:MAG: O-antigen ligase family protein [Pseudomonadales bacterium]
MQRLRALRFDRIQLNAILVVTSFVAVLTLSSQSAASYPTYILALSMLVSARMWGDVFESRLIWLVLVLVSYLCISTFWSDPFSGRELVSTLTRGVLIFSFVVALAECQLRGQVQRWMSRALGIVGGLVALIAVAGFYLDPPETYRLRGFGQLDHPVVAGLILSIVVLFLLQTLLSDRSTLWRSVALIAMAPVFVAISLTGSRNVWVSCSIGIVVYLFATFIRDKRSFPIAILGMLCVAIALIAGLAINEDTVELVLPRGDSFRLEIWSAVWNRLLESGLLFGAGLATPDSVELNGEVFQHPHNMYLAVAFQGGLVALALFLALILMVLVYAYRRFEIPDAKLLVALMATALSSYLLDGHELIDKVGETWFLFWLPVALGVGISWNFSGERRENLSEMI